MAVNPRGGELPDGTFLVENIIGQRSINGKKEYLFKWKGYTETTWEPERTLTFQLAASQYPKLIQRLKQGFTDRPSNEKKKGRKRKRTSGNKEETELQVPPNPEKKSKRSYQKKKSKMRSDPPVEGKENTEHCQTLPQKSRSYKKKESNKHSDPLIEIEEDEIEIETTSKKVFHSGGLQTEIIESDISYGLLEYFMNKKSEIKKEIEPQALSKESKSSHKEKNNNTDPPVEIKDKNEIETSKKGFLRGLESEMNSPHDEHEYLMNNKRSL